ncbi:hypothetical protein GIB67_031112 [Kingdonia uniflora]|uniref:Uncharacterized protein n=1 Tax=Kingdonia uniflora TaxID=39325 RepID=A0A7J7MEJ0_9MAGN|nr:hypothetical protein GIB67_031112 [Kingdonia uniflora]
MSSTPDLPFGDRFLFLNTLLPLVHFPLMPLDLLKMVKEAIEYLDTGMQQGNNQNVTASIPPSRYTDPKALVSRAFQERGRPKGSLKRTELLLACHTKQDGTFPVQIKEKMEYEEDGNGHVRGFSGHINKTSVRVITPLRKVIEREKSKKNQFADEATRDSSPPDGVRDRNYIMKDIYGGTVAYRSIQLSGVASKEFCHVIVDEVIHDNVQLFMEGGTLGDISSSETVVLYKSLTCLG